MMQKFLIVGAATLISATAALSSCAADSRGELSGNTVASSTATRTIAIEPGTAYVNVDRGDVVRFVVGDKTFTWNFTGPGTISEISLNDVAPVGVLDHPVKVYIKRIPIYDGG